MKRTFLSKLTYKTLFGYSLVIIALLIVAVPVFATTNPGPNLLDFSFSAPSGNSAQDARSLGQGVNVDHLNPGEEDWYTYTRNNFADAEIPWISLALRYESEALISPTQVNFEVLAQKPAGSWFQNPADPQEVVGLGLRSPLKTTNQSLAESFWTGSVAEQERYYVRVFNDSPFALDYALEAKAEQPALSRAVPASFKTTIGNAEALNTRQLAWTLTAMAVDNMTADQASIWMQEAQAVGWIVTADTLPEAIPDPHEADPQMLWTLIAQAIEGQEAQSAAQWLIQADSLGWLAIPPQTVKNPELRTDDDNTGDDEDDGSTTTLAEPIQPEVDYTPVNIYPNNPLELDLNNVNSGRLAPHGEHWYSLRRDDLDEDLIEDMALTMFFTPRTGYTSHYVNFELFPASQYHVWERGDADYMAHFGDGAWVSRDEDPNTGERLWSGSLVDGDRYLIKVTNGTVDVIDYYLFPDDVENAELGNPTLHQADDTAGRVSQPEASPPTRPMQPPVPGESPPESIPLKIGTTKGTLDAGEEIWYEFYYRDSYNDTTPQHDFIFYLTNTPLDDIRARHADFAIYPADQLQIWTRGTTDELEPLGTSATSPNETKDVKSLQVLWRGQLMEEHTYYVKIYNHDIGPLEYELEIQGGP
ncbi:MAG: hypothetical protein JW953_24020 [Anaerolineae bacterium]|nr:hypothetical protein [Anaerolineae bacterium]